MLLTYSDPNSILKPSRQRPPYDQIRPVKIYIDTNIYIGFYQSAEDPVGIIDTIAEYADSLVVPEQTVGEFHRNRTSVLNRLSSNFSQSVTVTPHVTSLVKHLGPYEQLRSATKEFKTAAKLVLRALDEVQDPTKDPVAQKITGLFAHAGVTRIPLTNTAIEEAHRRKLLGDPPTSPDKHTIGDEVIWESLLTGVQEDLIIVARDKTYFDNRQLLEREFEKKGGRKLILITKKLSDALKHLGKAPPSKLVDEENRIAALERCPNCGAKRETVGDAESGQLMDCQACGALALF